ncbi:MAG: flavodoxin family protein [Acidobacteria bacterium]|nr:flavodoxin family protein [Acidobacteriota bacterium]
MKRILVISGSPRSKGNTYKITRLVEEQMVVRGDVAFEYVSVGKLNLKHCYGCLTCMKKGAEKCPCKDDALMLRDKMLATDGIIFSSPVYVHTVSAVMKNFYDRFAYMCHQPHFRDKAAMFIVTTELTGGRETLEYMRFPAFTWGFKMCASLDVVYPGFMKGGKYREVMLNRISRAARDFYAALQAGDRKPLFRELMFFNLMKTKVTVHKEFLPEDYNYWKRREWLKRDFYTENNVSRFKSAIAKTMVDLKVKKMLKSTGLKDLQP